MDDKGVLSAMGVGVAGPHSTFLARYPAGSELHRPSSMAFVSIPTNANNPTVRGGTLPNFLPLPGIPFVQNSGKASFLNERDTDEKRPYCILEPRT